MAIYILEPHGKVLIHFNSLRVCKVVSLLLRWVSFCVFFSQRTLESVSELLKSCTTPNNICFHSLPALPRDFKICFLHPPVPNMDCALGRLEHICVLPLS